MATFVDRSIKRTTGTIAPGGLGLKEIATAITLGGLAPVDPALGQTAAVAATTNLGLPPTKDPHDFGDS